MPSALPFWTAMSNKLNCIIYSPMIKMELKPIPLALTFHEGSRINASYKGLSLFITAVQELLKAASILRSPLFETGGETLVLRYVYSN
jgi:hypothetical protein